MTWSFNSIRQAAMASQSVGAVDEQIAEMISSGVAKDEAFAALADLRAELREASKEPLEAPFGFFAGWCSPSARL